MNVTLNWTTGGGAAGQDVQYKLATNSTWITQDTVAGNATTYTINGLPDNLIHDFRIVTNCAGGSPAPSAVTQQVNLICPAVTTTVTDTTVAYSFTNVGGSTTGYTVHLLDSAGTSVLQTQSPAISATVSGTFSGLTQSTTYRVRVTILAGLFSKQCASVTTATTATPVCNLPTGLSASLVEETPPQ